MGLSSILNNLYVGNYKKFLILPAILFVFFLIMVFIYPGLSQGIDLKGGTLLLVRSDKALNADEMKSVLQQKFSLSDLSVTSISSPTGSGLVIQFAKNDLLFQAEENLKTAFLLLDSNPSQTIALCNEVLSSIATYYVPTDNAPIDAQELLEFSKDSLNKAKEAFHGELESAIVNEFSLGENVAFQIKEVAPTIGEIFWNNALFVSFIAIILIIIVIFFFFRMLIPSFAIIAAAIFDIVAALAGMAVFGIPLSLSTIPALLMLIGYSIDTDIMLTTRLTQGKGVSNLREKAASSLKTGLTMTLTTLGAASVMVLLAYLNQMFIIFEISSVIVFGLTGDLVSTWLMNAPMLLWYIEKKEGKTK